MKLLLPLLAYEINDAQGIGWLGGLKPAIPPTSIITAVQSSFFRLVSFRFDRREECLRAATCAVIPQGEEVMRRHV